MKKKRKRHDVEREIERERGKDKQRREMWDKRDKKTKVYDSEMQTPLGVIRRLEVKMGHLRDSCRSKENCLILTSAM